MDQRDQHIAELARLLDMPSVGVRPKGLGPLPWKLACVLASRPGVLTREFAYVTLYGRRDGGGRGPSLRIVDIYCSRLRKVLRPHGITIKMQNPEGYYLSYEDRKKLKELVRISLE